MCSARISVLLVLLSRQLSAFFVPRPVTIIPCVSEKISKKTSTFAFRSTPTVTMSASSSDEHVKPSKVVIAGAGVIGTSTAYFLAKNHNVQSTLVDPTGTIAPAASGKAGGFLALDWNDHTPPVGRLARRSFALHQELASEENFGAERIMYRRLTCAAVVVDPSRRDGNKPAGKKLQGVDWAQPEDADDDVVLGMRTLGDEDTIAQVHPKLLCEALYEETKSLVGCDLIKGEIEGPEYDGNGKLIGAKTQDGEVIECDAILFACGPWTKQSHMLGVKYHSVLIPTPRVLTQSVFFSGCGDPEVYPRPDGTAYCTGFPDAAIKVTERPGEEEVREDKVKTIVDAVRSASGKDGVLSAEPQLSQACYLPSTPDGIPTMGRVPGQNSCYVAAGHSCWGILLGPGSGETMASFIATGKSTEHVNIDWFDPGRF